MIFTRLGRAVAILALVAGVYNIAAGLMIATEMIGPYEVALQRYFPSKSSSGQIIDRGIQFVVFSVALGILAEIRYALRPQS
jgi:hypothetical protein